MEQQLMNASKEGNIDRLYAAIRENPHILSRIDEIPFVDTPLHIAASAGHIQFALEIMRLKPSFATKTNLDGWTPIHIAIQKNNTQMVNCFVEMDPGLVRVKGRGGVIPLHLVVRAGHMHLLKRFLSACPESLQDVTVRFETALHLAVKFCTFEAFQLLLNALHRDTTDEMTNDWKKRVLNFKDLEGNTVLHLSALTNKFQVTEILVSYNKSNPGMLQVNATNERKLTAMAIADLSQHQPIQQLLQQIASETQANLPDSNGINPIPETNHHQMRNSEIEDVAAAGSTNLSEEEIHPLEDYFKFNLRKSSPDNIRTDLLVVFVLMATATYQAVLSPPGGTDDHTGISRLVTKDRSAYIWFMVFNSAGFFVSMHIIMVLLHNYPLSWELNVAVMAMAVTYDSAMIAITPEDSRPFFILLSVIMPIAIPFIQSGLRKYYQRKLDYNRHVNA